MDCTNKSSVSYQTQNPSPVQPSNAQETPEESSKQPNKGNTHKRFLGVRQRPSGRWVAEIKDSSQKLRLWLGTYDREEEAAMAYDNAARLLRGRNARTNFSLNEMNMTQEGKFSLLSKNPRFYQLFRHAIMKSHAKSSSINTQNSKNHQKKVNDHDSDDFSTCVHETIFCSSHQSSASVEDGAIGCHGIQEQDGIQGFSLGGSRVYSTIHVAPSFSAASYQEKEEEEKKKRRHED